MATTDKEITPTFYREDFQRRELVVKVNSHSHIVKNTAETIREYADFEKESSAIFAHSDIHNAHEAILDNQTKKM